MNILDNAKIDILLPPPRTITCASLIRPFLITYSRNIPLRYPITLYRRDKGGKIEWLGFLFCLSYVSKTGKNVVLMSHPISFIEKYKIPIYQRLIEEAGKIALSLNADILEFEGFLKIDGELLSPSSDNFFGNLNDPEFIETLKTHGFSVVEKSACYQIDKKKVIWDDVGKYMPNDMEIYTERDFFTRRKKYLTLCRDSLQYPELIDISDKSLGRPPDITEKMFFKEDHILFLKSRQVEGCIRWAPDDLCKKAKMIRILFDREVDQTMKLRGIFRSSQEIFKNGISTIQVAKIFFTERKIMKVFKKIGAKRVQIMIKLQKNPLLLKSR